MGDLKDGTEPAPDGWTTLSNVVRPLIRRSLSSEVAPAISRIFDQARLRDAREAQEVEAKRREQAYEKAGGATAAALRQAREEKAAQAAERVGALKQAYRKAELASAVRSRTCGRAQTSVRGARSGTGRGRPALARIRDGRVGKQRRGQICGAAQAGVQGSGGTPGGTMGPPTRSARSSLRSGLSLNDAPHRRDSCRWTWTRKKVPDLLTPPSDRHEGANAARGTDGRHGRQRDRRCRALSLPGFGKLVGRPVLIRPEEVSGGVGQSALGIEPRQLRREGRKRKRRPRFGHTLKSMGKTGPSPSSMHWLGARSASERAWIRVWAKVAKNFPVAKSPRRPSKKTLHLNPRAYFSCGVFGGAFDRLRSAQFHSCARTATVNTNPVKLPAPLRSGADDRPQEIGDLRDDGRRSLPVR